MASYGQTPIEDGRAAFNVYEEDDRHVEPPLQQQSEDDHSISATSSSGSQIEESPGRPTTLAKVRQASRCVRSKAKAKSKKIFHPGATHEASPQSSTAPSLAPPPSTQADDDRLYRDPPEHKGIQAKDLLRSPVSTVQSALHGASGGKMAQVVDNQAIAHGANVNLVRAHDKVASAQEGEEKQEAMDDLESLNKARQDTYVRWTMDRHVLKVRRMPPHNLSRPLKKDYMNKNDDGKGRVQWAAYSQDLARYYAKHYADEYIDESSELPPATEEAINTSIERLLMTSIPYQAFIMEIRHIYRWDNPSETGMWLGAYVFCWATGYMSAAMVLLAIVLVLKRRFLPPTLEDMRQSIKKSEDVDQTATNITQLIEQNGSKGWMDTAIKDLGPRGLLQLEDMADTLEIVRNFYEWRNPRQTTITMCMLVVFWIWASFTPLWLMVKSTQFTFGVMLFGSFPISSRMPHYRIMVSPWTWLFWRIPTDAQWAIARLQLEGHHTQDSIKHRNAKSKQSSVDSAIALGKYHCKHMNHQGDLHLTTEDVYYISAVRSNEMFRIRYDEMSTIKKARFGAQIIFGLEDGKEWKVEALKEANEVFSQMVGYSGLKWQVTG